MPREPKRTCCSRARSGDACADHVLTGAGRARTLRNVDESNEVRLARVVGAVDHARLAWIPHEDAAEHKAIGPCAKVRAREKGIRGMVKRSAERTWCYRGRQGQPGMTAETETML